MLVGLVLWLQRWQGPRRFLLPEKTAMGVRRTRGWHAAIGVWLALMLLVLSATG